MSDLVKPYEGQIKADKDKELRMRYFRTIVQKGEFSQSFMTPPAHWLNPDIYIIGQDLTDTVSKSPKKNKSLVTILSVWNTMIGSCIVGFPNLVKNAGIIPTIGKYKLILNSIKSGLWIDMLLYMSSDSKNRWKR
jgi:hypothetical protein